MLANLQAEMATSCSHSLQNIQGIHIIRLCNAVIDYLMSLVPSIAFCNQLKGLNLIVCLLQNIKFLRIYDM
jgi:hypothetical protein